MKIFFFSLIALLLIGCTDRREVNSHYEPAIVFASADTTVLPETVEYTTKRGFDDFNGDGITDMFAIMDESGFFEKQDFQAKIYFGFYNSEGILNFDPEYEARELKIQMSWWSDAVKMDVGDINGDGYADVVFSQYRSYYGEDELKLAIAINQSGDTFKQYTEKLYFPGSESLVFDLLLIAFVEQYSSGYEESLSDYLMMDWADMDGNGSDDFVMVWDDRHDAYVEVIYTKKTHGAPELLKMEEFFIENFLYHRSVRRVDFEDYNGDGLDDMLVRSIAIDSVDIGVAYNDLDRGLVPCQDYRVRDVDFKFFDFEKYDTFDINNDGRADFIHVGVLGTADGDKKSMSYNLSTGVK